MLSEKILFGELKSGEIVAVDATGETKDDTFTFQGTPHSRGIELPGRGRRGHRELSPATPLRARRGPPTTRSGALGTHPA